MSSPNDYTFNISLSVLNHLGRNLYRNFVTVLGEAISNSWDADASNVYITIDKKNDSFTILDDGLGMDADDFQNKFLKIGYSKRKDGDTTTEKGRPFIGRKGIGKLALLSCADTITVISKKYGGNYVGGAISNKLLDEAITDDLNANEYHLTEWKETELSGFTKHHEKGTIIRFDGVNGGITNTLQYIKKIISLYFRFSLIDKDFNIHINEELITLESLDETFKKTQLIWVVNDLDDPFIQKCQQYAKVSTKIEMPFNAKGFIASVKVPSDLKIRQMDERLSLDLFVNGRLREKNFIKNIPTNRLAESYIYGQIHLDNLDEGDDPFTSSREEIKGDNHTYQLFLTKFRGHILLKIIEQWDGLRRDIGKDGDAENRSISRKRRKSEELFNATSDDYKDTSNNKSSDTAVWLKSLKDDAAFNFSSYAECFISENLIRNFIEKQNIVVSPEAKKEIIQYRKRQDKAKNAGNISIDIRENDDDLSFLAMQDLAALSDKPDNPEKTNNLLRDSREYKPMRDAIMHTAILSQPAKLKLTSVYENIKGRVKQLINNDK